MLIRPVEVDIPEAIETLWTEARDRVGAPRERRRPAPGVSEVLTAMFRSGCFPLHGSEIARRSGQGQANVTALTLPKLVRFGFAQQGLAVRGPGRPAQFWTLTPAGQQLAGLLVIERTAHDPDRKLATAHQQAS